QISKCSMVLAKPGDELGVVVAAYENPMLRNLEIELARYPEIQRALTGSRPVLVEDVSSDPLYESERLRWEREGITVPTRSAVALPFSMKDQQLGVFFLRTTGEDPPLTRADAEFARSCAARRARWTWSRGTAGRSSWSSCPRRRCRAPRSSPNGCGAASCITTSPIRARIRST